MNDSRSWHRPLWVVLLLLLLFALVWFFWPNGRYPLHPLRFTPTPENTVNSEPLLVTFAELNADPMRYHNQRLRVTGLYQPLISPDCFPMNGPIVEWALIAQGLQMNAQGYEYLLNQIAPATNLTVDGLWLLYGGPVGCGKQPPDGVVWYLVVERIVQPNPLVAVGYTPGAIWVISGDVTPIGQLPTITPGTPGLPGPTSAVLSATPTSLTGVPTLNATPTQAPTLTATPGLPPPPSTTPPGYPPPPASPSPASGSSTPAYP